MRPCTRVAIALLLMTGTALAQEERPPPEKPEEPKEPKEPQKGDFDAGLQTRLPSGPDEMGDFQTGNWVAVDAKGQYLVLDSVAVKGNVPIALEKPSQLMDGSDPRAFGGMQITLEAMLPEMDVPMAPKSKDTQIGLTLTGAYMREGAMLLSEKDYPLFVGGFHPGFSGGLTLKTKVSSLLDVSFVPQWVYQDGDAESLTAVQIPVSLILGLGDIIKVSTDIGVYTGDDYTLRSSKGGRVSLGGALDVKVWRLIIHGGAGVASLGTGDSSAYPTIGDSVYLDLNVKFAK